MTDDFKTMEYEEIYHIVTKNNRLTVNSAKHLKLLSGSFGGGRVLQRDHRMQVLL